MEFLNTGYRSGSDSNDSNNRNDNNEMTHLTPHIKRAFKGAVEGTN